MTNTKPLEKLKYIISQYGRTICEDARRCEAMLRDLCPECKREVNILTLALKDGVAEELMKITASTPKELVLARLTQRLYDNIGMSQEFALWAVDSWAMALGIISSPRKGIQPTLKQQPVQHTQIVQTASSLTAFERWIEPVIGMEFVLIPPGTFMMGSPANEPGRFDNEVQHKVTLTRAVYMQTTPVTQRQWQTIMGNNPSHFKNNGDACPVEKVSWEDAQSFIQRLNQKQGKICRLPTEAEWEYACRAGSRTAYANGNSESDLNAMGWYVGNSGSTTHPVGQKQPNAWGLYDMHGNVWEWCQDWYEEYPNRSVTDPMGASSGSSRVLRGGGWCSRRSVLPVGEAALLLPVRRVQRHRVPACAFPRSAVGSKNKNSRNRS